MGFLGTVTPLEVEAGRVISLSTMAILLGVGFVPPLGPYARRIRVVTAACYVLCLFGFVIYCALFR